MNCCKICSLLLSFFLIAGTLSAQSILESEGTSTEKVFTEAALSKGDVKACANMTPEQCSNMSPEECAKLCPTKCCKGAKASATSQVSNVSEASSSAKKCLGIFPAGCCKGNKATSATKVAVSAKGGKKCCGIFPPGCCKGSKAKETSTMTAQRTTAPAQNP